MAEGKHRPVNGPVRADAPSVSAIRFVLPITH